MKIIFLITILNLFLNFILKLLFQLEIYTVEKKDYPEKSHFFTTFTFLFLSTYFFISTCKKNLWC